MSFFQIQLGNPTVIPWDGEAPAADLSDAVETIFAARTESAILLWNRIPVRIHYRYDLSALIDDLLPLLQHVVEQDAGSHETSWGSESFQGTWHLSWEDGQITIDALWGNVAGGYQDTLAQRARVKIGRDDFLAEWKSLLALVQQAIERSGIELEDSSSRDTLRALVAAIPRAGYLYAAD